MKHDYAGDLLVVIGEVMTYAKSSTLYEMQCKIDDAKEIMRHKTLESDAAEMHLLTKNLALAKLKLELLKKTISGYPVAYQETLTCLFEDAEQYIDSLRIQRACIVTRRRA